MASPDPPSARPPWLDFGQRPTRLTPTSAVLVVLALVVLGGGLAAAAIRGSSPSTLLRSGPTLRPTSTTERHGFPQSVACTAAGARWACVPGEGGSQAYRLLAVSSDAAGSSVHILGSDSAAIPPQAAGSPSPTPPTAIVCTVTGGQLRCSANSLPPTPGTPRAVYVRSR